MRKGDNKDNNNNNNNNRYRHRHRGTRHRGTINNKDRIAATIYPLGTWFVSGIFVWLPYIKETMMIMMKIIIIIIIIIIIKNSLVFNTIYFFPFRKFQIQNNFAQENRKYFHLLITSLESIHFTEEDKPLCVSCLCNPTTNPSTYELPSCTVCYFSPSRQHVHFLHKNKNTKVSNRSV